MKKHKVTFEACNLCYSVFIKLHNGDVEVVHCRNLAIVLLDGRRTCYRVVRISHDEDGNIVSTGKQICTLLAWGDGRICSMTDKEYKEMSQLVLPEYFKSKHIENEYKNAIYNTIEDMRIRLL